MGIEPRDVLYGEHYQNVCSLLGVNCGGRVSDNSIGHPCQPTVKIREQERILAEGGSKDSFISRIVYRKSDLDEWLNAGVVEPIESEATERTEGQK